ncbi:MAG: DEAD/DEAH box helicase [Actinobacteria bacterium]|nr:DEAD/DEAH box helicase [Actinomycetota bacterium]
MTTIKGAVPGWVLQLTDASLARRHGEGTMARGVGYAADGHVRSVSVADHGGVILAEVDGSGPHGYTTLITAVGPLDGALDGAFDEDEVTWSARCSCPVRSDCKHAVATLVALRDALGPRRVESSWRERLAPWAEAARDPEADQTPLGVQLVLVEGRPGPWGERSRRVEIRALRRSRVGRWVSVSSWAQAESGFGSEAVPPAHRALASELLRIVSARSPWGTHAPVLLEDLGAEAWAWLRRALAEGLELRTGGVVGRAGLAPEALHLDADELLPVVTVRAAPEGGLTAAVAWDGVEEDVRVSLLGTPPHSALLEPRRGRSGVRTVRPLGGLDPKVAALVADHEFQVPEDDVAEFVADYLPALRRHVTVQSPDGAIDATATTRPVLHVTVRPSAGAGIELAFGLRYVTGSRHGPLLPVEVPLSSPHRRVRRAEAELLRGIPALGEVPGCRLGMHDRQMHRVPPDLVRLTGPEAMRVLSDVVPELEAHPDVEVERVDGLPVFEEAGQAPVVTLDVDEPLEGSTDWFDLTVSVLVDEEAVPLSDLLVAMRRGDEVLVLPSGTWFRLDHPALEPLRQLLEEAQVLTEGGATSATVRLGRYDLGRWEELVLSGVVGRQCEAWQRHARVLDPGALAAAASVPEGLRATLRPYQVEGYQWLSALWDARLGGVLADDMGLGKTVQTLALAQRALEAGELTKPVLVVAPTSVLATWVGEAARFTPDLSVRAVPRTSRSRGRPLSEEIAGAHLVVTSYAVARIDAAEFASVAWQALVLDEAQQVKNHRSKTYQAVRRLDREVTFTVTGTPIENDLMDLWSQLSLAAPGLFPAPEEFQRGWARPIAGGDRALAVRLRSRIRPLMLRRTKEEVAPDLPPKTVSVVRLELTPGHRRIYDRALLRERQRMLGLLEDPEANRVEILAALTRMRQLALDPALVPALAFPGVADPPVDTLPSAAKIDHLVEQVVELAAEGHRALVFSQFTSFLARVRARLDAAGLASAYLDGSTRDRQQVIRGFKEGEAPVFLISLKAGGVGLTLTEADYVFVLDPWWNPAAEAQAIDRAHRIGQDKAVMVYRLVSADTIEDKVLALQDRKRALADRLVGDDPFTGGLTPQDILGLFDPREPAAGEPVQLSASRRNVG